MNNFGLPENIIFKVWQVFDRFPQIERAVVFGSRAKGNYTPHSDVDIAIFGGCDELMAEGIADELDETKTPSRLSDRLINLSANKNNFYEKGGTAL